ncbi:50S ribosomal protein L13 [bacterium]|nr:50S ribosomal protein L13 [bacterium]
MTKFFTEQEVIKNRGWVLFDATNQVVGRLASKIATTLRGKDKSYFAGYQDSGDFVVVINAEKARFTGNKLDQKIYHKHTGFVGNMKSETARTRLSSHPDRIIIDAVKGMLPKTAQGKRQIKKLKVYAGAEHPHTAQQPKIISTTK